MDEEDMNYQSENMADVAPDETENDAVDESVPGPMPTRTSTGGTQDSIPDMSTVSADDIPPEPEDPFKTFQLPPGMSMRGATAVLNIIGQTRKQRHQAYVQSVRTSGQRELTRLLQQGVDEPTAIMRVAPKLFFTDPKGEMEATLQSARMREAEKKAKETADYHARIIANKTLADSLKLSPEENARKQDLSLAIHSYQRDLDNAIEKKSEIDPAQDRENWDKWEAKRRITFKALQDAKKERSLLLNKTVPKSQDEMPVPSNGFGPETRTHDQMPIGAEPGDTIPSKPTPVSSANEVMRMVKGRRAVFDKTTKQFIRYAD